MLKGFSNEASGQDGALPLPRSPVRGEHHRLAVLLDGADDAPELPARGGIHAGARLVEEDDGRVAHERLRDVQLPLVAPAVCPALPVSVLKQNLQLDLGLLAS